MWTEIKTDSDIDNVKNIFDYFYDSCLRDLYVSTRHSVDSEGSMSFASDLVATLLFQRQSKTNNVLELKIVGLRHLHFKSLSEEYGSIIESITFKKENGLFYIADVGGWTQSNFNSDQNDSFWLCGQKAYWRLRPDLIGNIARVVD